MNYKTATTERVKECKKCGITKSVQTEFLSGYGSCKECMYEKQRDYAKRSANKGVPQKRESEKLVKREYEAQEIWDMPEFQSYCKLLLSVFVPGEWLTVAEIHRRVKEPNVIRKWTYDALSDLGVEKDATKLLDRFRLVERKK